MNPKTENIALALGSNLGDRQAMLRAAVAEMAFCVTVTARSPVYETAPAYVTDQPSFLNAALVGKTTLEPSELLRALKDLEQTLGRVPTFDYGPRLIDIDFIFYGDVMMTAPGLTLPHPRLAERTFVLRPLADIAPHWRHPDSGLTVADMLARVPDSGARRFGSL